MLKFLARGDKEIGADDVVSAVNAEAFLRTLPPSDPIASQRAICDALISIKGPRGPEIDRLRALTVLERGAHQLLEDLLSDYASPSGAASERETKLRQPIVELSRSFAQAYEHFYRHVRDNPGDPAWMEHAPSILVSLLRQREVDLLLALFRYEKLARARSKDLNAVYAFALEQGWTRIAVPVEVRGENASINVEEAFIRILLLQLADGGQLLPVEIAMARRWIGRWCPLLSLTPVSADDAIEAPALGFRIDLAGSQGLKRPSSLHSIEGRRLQLDTSPLGAAIDEAAAAVRARSVDSASDALERSRQAALLARLKLLFAAEQPRVRRRGERTKVQSISVHTVIGGLQSIGRILRNESRKVSDDAPAQAHVEEITIGDVTDYTTVTGRAVPRDVAGGFLPVVGVDGLEALWHVQDRSESGCLLRGQTLDGEHSLPGSLMALREPDAAWQVAVVRRLSKVTGAQLELGVEYIGRNPQRVVLLSDRDGEKPRRFVALYLPESDAHPRIPIKTLIVPAHEHVAARILTLVSTAGERPIRLKDPIEQQRDFVWAPFDLL